MMLIISKSIRGRLPIPPAITGVDPLSVAITYYWLIGAMLLFAVVGAISVLMTPHNTAYHAAAFGFALSCLPLLWLLFQPRGGRWVVKGIAWYSIVVLAIMSYTSGGVFTPAYSAMVIPIFLNGFVNGRRASIVSFGVVLLVGGILLELASLSLLPSVDILVIQRVIAFSGYLGLLTLTIDFIVQALQRIAQQEQQQKEALLKQQQVIHDHDMMLAMLADVSHQFLRGDTWEECMDVVLPKIGAASDTARVFVYEIVNNLGREWVVTKRYEWVADDVLLLDDAIYFPFEMRKNGFGRWIDVLSKGDIIMGNVVDDYPASERTFLAPLNIAAQLVVPLYSYTEVWGFIGFDCQTRRQWASAEVDVLRALSEAMSAAIQRSDTREKLFRVLSDEVQQNETLRRHQYEIESRDGLLRLLAELTSKLLEDEDWSALVELRLPDIATLTGADAVFLHQVIPVGNDDWRVNRLFHTPRSMDLPPTDPEKDPTLRALGLGRWIELLRGGEALFANVADLPPAEQVIGKAYGSVTIAIMPIRTPYSVWGIITLTTNVAHTWTAVQKNVLRALAEAIGTAIQRRTNHQRMLEVLLYTQAQNDLLTQQQNAIEQRDQLMTMVADISNAFLRDDQWLPVADAHLPNIAIVAGADRLYLYQAIAKGPHDWIVERRMGWRKVASEQAGDPLGPRFSLSEKGFARWVYLLEHGESIISNVVDMPESEQTALRALGSAAELVIPIVVSHETWGFISFSNEQPQAWNPIQITTLRTLADAIGAAVQRFETRQRLMSLFSQEHQQNSMLRYQQTVIETRDQMINMVSEVTRRFMAADNWETVIAQTMGEIGEGAAVDRIFLFEIDETQPDDWVVSHRYGWLRDHAVLVRHPQMQRRSLKQDGMWHWFDVLRTGDHLASHVEDMPDVERLALEVLFIQSQLLIPIKLGGSVWGFIGYGTFDKRNWSVADIATLETLADTIAAAIQRTMTRYQLMNVLEQEVKQNELLRYQKAEIEQRDRLLKLVADVAGQLLGNETWDAVLPRVIPEIGAAAEVDRLFMFQIVDQQPDDWTIVHLFGWSSADGVTGPDPRYHRVSLRAIGLGRWVPIMRDNTHMAAQSSELPEAERVLLEQDRVASYLTVPIRIEGQPWGYIGFTSQAPLRWHTAQIDALVALADAIGSAIQRAGTHQRLVEMVAHEQEQNVQLRQQQADIQQRDRLLSMVADVTRGFLGSETWDDVFQPMVVEIGMTMEVDRVFVWEIVEHKPDDWILQHRTSWHRDNQTEWSAPNQLRRSLKADGLSRWFAVMQHGDPIIGNVKDFPASEQALQASMGVAAQLIMPIMINGVVWGFIGLATQQPLDWTSVHQDVAKMLADTLGMAIQRTDTRLRLIHLLATETANNEHLRHQQREIEQRDRLLNMVSDVTRRFLSSDTWQEVLPTVIPDIGRAAGVDRVFFLELVEDTGDDWIISHVMAWHRATAFVGADPNLQRRSIKADGLIRWREIMSSGAPIVGNVADFPESERAMLEAMGVHAQLVMPIWINDQIWGIIGFAIERSFEWKSSHIDVLKTLADTVGAAIQLTQTRQWLMDAVAHEQEQNDLLRFQQHEIEQRDILLRVLADTTKRFLQSETWADVIPEALLDIGVATGVDRVCVYTLSDVSEDDWLVSQQYCWRGDNRDHPMDVSMDAIPVRAIGFMQRSSTIGTGDVVHGHVDDFPTEERAFLRAMGVASQLVMPIFVDNLPWGFIGYGTYQRHLWPEAEIDALKTFADALGAAIQRHDARLRLVKSESEVRAILSAIPDPLVRVDRAGNYIELYSSPSTSQAFRRDDYLGKRVEDLWPEAAANHYKQAINDYLNGNDTQPIVNQFDMELPVVGRRIIEVTSVRWDDKSVLSLGRDITTAKQAALNIAASEAKFRAIYEGSPDVMLVIDAETNLVEAANPALTRILHLEADEVVNRSIHRIFRLADESLATTFKQIRVDGAGFGHTYITTSEGNRVPLDVAGAVLALSDGEAILLTLRDTTERARVAELSVLLEKEHELNTLRQQFIQTVSHEFRTPLAIIQLSDEILENYADRLTAEQRRSRHEMIRRQVEVMRAMVENVTRYGAVLQGVALSPSEIEVEPFIETIVHDTDSLHENPRIGLTTDISTPIYYGDPNLLRQVVQNLINNALRYSKPDKAVFVWVACNTKHLRIRVADEGMGIPPGFLPDLFMPFRRAENAQAISGTGIGLAITKRIVDQHGGTITVDSQLGQGTVFEVVLPQDAIPRVLPVGQAPANRGILGV